jgi:hypothetical protein
MPSLSEHKLTPIEMNFLQQTLTTDFKPSNIRLREGEHQYGLAKAIASFQLELYLPDVKDIVKKLYGEEKTADIQLIRKVQTILKKMEKSSIVKILPKKMPWELQRYAVSGFKFEDAEKTLVVLATDEEIRQAQTLLDTASSQQGTHLDKWNEPRARSYILLLSLMVAASYTTIIWDILQPIVSPIIFISAFTIAAVSSIFLGRFLSKE